MGASRPKDNPSDTLRHEHGRYPGTLGTATAPRAAVLLREKAPSGMPPSLGRIRVLCSLPNPESKFW